MPGISMLSGNTDRYVLTGEQPAPHAQACGAASWLLPEDDGQTLTVTHRSALFGVDAVVTDLRRRRHPNAEFAASILTGRR
jgi:hypothetical protein